jgi:LCP family protein required for cell wall assembly
MVLVLLLLWATFIVAVPFVTWRSAEQVAYEPDGDRPSEQGGTTYLLVGSDSRRNLSKAERKKLSTGNPQSELTDTMLLLHTGDGPSVLLSVPRDTIIDRPFFSGKINGAYARGGAPLLTRVIETETGIRVDKYVEIGLGGVADVVDAVGGIRVCPVERLKDPLAGLNIRKGCQEIDGTTALAYSRSRKQSTFGDLERVRRQREVIGAIGSKVLSPWSVVNPFRWWKLNRAVPTFFGFGEGMGALDASRWALAMTKTGSGDNLTCTMPVTDLSANTWDRERADPLFAAIIDDKTDEITKKQCTPNGIER